MKPDDRIRLRDLIADANVELASAYNLMKDIIRPVYTQGLERANENLLKALRMLREDL